LLTGGTGQLGDALLKTAPEQVSIVSPSSSELDLAEPDSLHRKIAAYNADIIINAAAYTAVDKAEEEAERAYRINAESAGRIAAYTAAHSMPFIQVSTDFVFCGETTRPYVPSAATQPATIYGKSKLAGENAVRRADSSAWIVRAGWIYSEHGHNFVKTILRIGATGKPLRVVNDQTGTPTYARNLAEAIWCILDARPKQKVIHYADAGQATWYEFACNILNLAAELGLLNAPSDISPVSTADYGAAAPRPAYSVLDISDTLAIPGICQPDWQTALRDMLARLQAG